MCVLNLWIDLFRKILNVVLYLAVSLTFTAIHVRSELFAPKKSSLYCENLTLAQMMKGLVKVHF